VSEHGGGAPGAATAAALHPCLCCVFMILFSGMSGRARSAVCDGVRVRHRQTNVMNLYIR
jgi:hypothetical protein